MKLRVSIDGGETYEDVLNSVIVYYDDLYIPGEDGKGTLQLACTHEGVIEDVWVDREGTGSLSHNIGTRCELVDDIVERLVEDGA